jgi:hypothetical protein
MGGVGGHIRELMVERWKEVDGRCDAIELLSCFRLMVAVDGWID